MKRLVKQTFHKNKSGGYKKLHKRENDEFAGLTQRKISKVIMEDPKLRKHSIKITNKARARPFRVKNVHNQHQIDLVNICNMAVTYNGKTYNYILSLLDIFSRFHWLCPLESKHSNSVTNELKRIYKMHGIPKRIQSDNGGEFKKHVKKFCEKMKIKMVRCRPYHPQSQG